MSKHKFILKVSNGEIRRSLWQNGSRFWWEDGNAACDCNRAIAFGETQDHDCGNSEFELVNKDGTPYDDWPVEDE